MITYEVRQEPVDGCFRWVVLRRRLSTEVRIAVCLTRADAHVVAGRWLSAERAYEAEASNACAHRH